MKLIKIKARDGHLCDSKEEKLLDDFLHLNGIEHTKVQRKWALSQYFYPGSHSYPDWIVHGEYIEYLGLSGMQDYDKKVERKINAAKSGRHYHFLVPNRNVFSSNCRIIHVSNSGNVTVHLIDYRTYIMKRFRQHANRKLDYYVD